MVFSEFLFQSVAVKEGKGGRGKKENVLAFNTPEKSLKLRQNLVKSQQESRRNYSTDEYRQLLCNDQIARVSPLSDFPVLPQAATGAIRVLLCTLAGLEDFARTNAHHLRRKLHPDLSNDQLKRTCHPSFSQSGVRPRGRDDARGLPAVLDEAVWFTISMFFVSASRIPKFGGDASACAPQQRAPIAGSCRFAEIGL